MLETISAYVYIYIFVICIYTYAYMLTVIGTHGACLIFIFVDSPDVDIRRMHLTHHIYGYVFLHTYARIGFFCDVD